MRLAMFNGIFAGIGATILAFALINDSIPTYYISLLFLMIVGIIAVWNTFSEVYINNEGFVHPEDKLIGNYLFFCFIIAEILTFGYFYKDARPISFITGLGIFVGLVFLFFLTLLQGINPLAVVQGTVTQKDYIQKEKEATARILIFAIILGLIIASIEMGFLAAYDQLEYSIAATALAITAVTITGIFSLLLLTRESFPV
jgi:hypothetical protein